MREALVRFLCWEDPLEKRKATHSSTLDWRIPWIHGVAKSRPRLSNFHFPFLSEEHIFFFFKQSVLFKSFSAPSSCQKEWMIPPSCAPPNSQFERPELNHSARAPSNDYNSDHGKFLVVLSPTFSNPLLNHDSRRAVFSTVQSTWKESCRF